jgi:hypothetical protein
VPLAQSDEVVGTLAPRKSTQTRDPALTSTGNIDQRRILYYRANKNDCSTCSLKPKCTTALVRKVTRDIDEDVRERVRALANAEDFQQSRRERKTAPPYSEISTARSP